MIKLRVIFIGLVLLGAELRSAVPALERELNLTLSNEKVSSVLQKIQDQAQLIFSYQASLINDLPPVTVHLRKKTVREALLLILPRKITFKSVNNYVILKEKPAEKVQARTEISGYVYDEVTEEKVPNVTIYDKNSLRSVTTNEYGYFAMSLPADSVSLVVNKQDYKDTTLLVQDTVGAGLYRVKINRLKNLVDRADSIRWKETLSEVNNLSRKALQGFKGYVNTLNSRDTLRRKFQVSFLPFVGTNHHMSGNVYNDVSLNIISGYSRGVNGFEAGLVNLVKENVRGCQLGGLFNIVGDSVKGTQLAGLMNITGRDSRGMQGAGLMNINEKQFEGFQGAGLMNINTSGRGTSAAGLMNITNAAYGAQLAGMANVNDTLQGIALSGLFNVTGFGRKNVQVSGLFNSTRSGTTAVQLAGLFNSAQHLAGVQVAPLNFCDTASGVPVGLLSFVKNGIHQLELSADERFYYNVNLRTGVNSFYNILSFGYQPGRRSYWQVGYGAGTSFMLKKKLRTDLSISVHHISSGSLYLAASEMYKGYIGLEYRFGKKFSVAAGPTFNLYITDVLLPDYVSAYQDLVPSPLFDATDSFDFNRKGWIGGRVALRFF